ncbi:MAG TPA: glycosyltransferase family 39 protein, partial [Thermoanaerobaculia bacterium]|nr:glycosyltransferase family 39 protein [Thermoanaerobaculia bacterium]
MDPPGSRRGERRGRARALLPGAVIALAFLFVGLSVLDDFGMTWDENESYGAGLQNLEIVRTVAAGGTDFAWPWHELRGYQFLFDTARAGFALLVAPVPIEAFHLFHLLLSSATLFLTYTIALEVSGRVRTGVLSALVLATTPKFVAHSQNNPKDAVGLLVFALAVWAVARATRAARDGGGRGSFGWA